MKKYVRLTGVVVLCIILLKIDLTKLLSIFTHLHFIPFAAAVFLNIPAIFIKSLRWNQLLQNQSVRYSIKDSFLIYLSSIYTGILTPGRFGEFTKALYLKSDHNMSLPTAMSSVLVDRLFDMYLLIILGAVGIWKFNVIGAMSVLSVLLVIIVAFAPLIALNEKVMRNLLSFLFNSAIVKKSGKNLKDGFENFYCSINQLINRRLIVAALLTLLSYSVFFVQCYLLVMAEGISINFLTIILFMAISNLISFIPVSVSGLGTRDAILIYLFSIIGLNPELAVSYAFLVFINFFVCGGLMGAVGWWVKPLNINVRENMVPQK